MRLHRAISLGILILLAVFFATGNLWVSALRSTIPMALDGEVATKACLIEKTPGVDDVYIVNFDDDSSIQVDGAVFEAISVHQIVRKDAWSRNMIVGSVETNLAWSRDFVGMLWAMPLTLLICVAVPAPAPPCAEPRCWAIRRYRCPPRRRFARPDRVPP